MKFSVQCLASMIWDVSCEQDETKPAVLYNHGNEYLHYEDDWYILAQKPDEYVVVYYKGNNDAWQGYGGAVVYTRYISLVSVSRPLLLPRCVQSVYVPHVPIATPVTPQMCTIVICPSCPYRGPCYSPDVYTRYMSLVFCLVTPVTPQT
jgi:hypothetical protein